MATRKPKPATKGKTGARGKAKAVRSKTVRPKAAGARSRASEAAHPARPGTAAVKAAAKRSADARRSEGTGAGRAAQGQGQVAGGAAQGPAGDGLPPRRRRRTQEARARAARGDEGAHPRVQGHDGPHEAARRAQAQGQGRPHGGGLRAAAGVRRGRLLVPLSGAVLRRQHHSAAAEPARRADPQPGQGRRRSALHARRRAAPADRAAADRRLPRRRTLGRDAVLRGRQRHRRQSDGAVGARLRCHRAAGGPHPHAALRPRAGAGAGGLRGPHRAARRAQPHHAPRVPCVRLRDPRWPGHLQPRPLARAHVHVCASSR